MARTSKYTREVLTDAVAASVSIAGVLRHLRVPWSGGMHAHISRRIKFFELDTTHFTGSAHNRGLISPDRLTPDQILVLRTAGSRRTAPYLLRRALVETGMPYQCSECGVSGDWNGLPLILHVDHVNGNYLDSRPGKRSVPVSELPQPDRELGRTEQAQEPIPASAADPSPDPDRGGAPTLRRR
jgi:hypothetical protein